MLNTILYNTDISNYQSYFWIKYDVSVPRTRSELASHPTFTRSLYGKYLVCPGVVTTAEVLDL